MPPQIAAAKNWPHRPRPRRRGRKGGGELLVAPPAMEGELPAAPSANGGVCATPFPPPPVPGDWTEEFVTCIMRQVGGMVNARLEAIETRLTPQESFRLTLA